MNIEVMTMNKYFTLPRSPYPKPHHLIKFTMIHRKFLFLVCVVGTSHLAAVDIVSISYSDQLSNISYNFTIRHRMFAIILFQYFRLRANFLYTCCQILRNEDYIIIQPKAKCLFIILIKHKISYYMIQLLRVYEERCSWFNSYCCWKWVRWPEFKNWMMVFAFYIAQIHLGKVWMQLFFLQRWINSGTDCNIMTKGFRFMPLGLVRLRTFRLSAWVTKVRH